jgi:hypothetical protein
VTISSDQFIDLDDFSFVTNVTCSENTTYITTETSEDMEELGNALVDSPSGLLYGGQIWECEDSLGRPPGPIYRYM